MDNYELTAVSSDFYCNETVLYKSVQSVANRPCLWCDMVCVFESASWLYSSDAGVINV